MKYLLTTIIAVMFVFTGCDKKTTDSDENNDVQTYSSMNVKDNTDYFSFATNSGSINANSNYDIMFYSIQWQPAPQAPVINDPRFAVKEGLSVAVLDGSKLDDITEVPSTGNFINNFVSELGEWYNETDAHVLVPQEKVYVVNTTDGKFPAFQITGYYDGMGNSGVFSIDWKYLSE